MREIKFRVWDIKNRRWVEDEHAKALYVIDRRGNLYFIVEDTYEDAIIPVEGEFEISLYTGLKDKSGKEIYEGDIVKAAPKPTEDCLPRGEEHIGVVEWYDGGFALKKVYRGRDGKVYEVIEPLHITNEFDEIEVISSIYENPNLEVIK